MVFIVASLRVFVLLIMAQSIVASHYLDTKDNETEMISQVHTIQNVQDEQVVSIENPFKQEMLLDARIRLLFAQAGLGCAQTMPISYQSGCQNASIVFSDASGFYSEIDPEWFNLLSDQEQKFVIAHETFHYVNSDPLVRRLWLGLTSAIALKVVSESINNGNYKKATGSFLGIIIGGALIDLLFCRYAERRADWFAAAKHGPDSGLAFFSRLEQSPDSWKEYFKGFFSTHPAVRERIAALKKLQNLQAQAAVALASVPETVQLIVDDELSM